MKRAKSVDDFIETAERWQEELRRLRKILVSTPLEEEVKWGGPCYTYKGNNVIGVGAFKSYFGLWFHQGALLKDDKKVLINAQEGKTKALRQWRMQSAKDIQPATIKRYVKESMQHIDAGKKITPTRNKPIRLPAELKAALHKNKSIAGKFNSLSPGKQREFSDYIATAKREATRLSRIEKILPMISAGIGLNDKYRQ